MKNTKVEIRNAEFSSQWQWAVFCLGFIVLSWLFIIQNTTLMSLRAHPDCYRERSLADEMLKQSR